MQASIDYIGIGVGGILINKEGDILLLKRNRPPEAGCWSIPGGAIEYGERAEEAVLRELKEETGLACAVTDFLGFHDYILPEEHRHWLSLFFVVISRETAEPVNAEPNKHVRIQWFNRDNLPDSLTENTIKAITLYQKWIDRILRT